MIQGNLFFMKISKILLYPNKYNYYGVILLTEIIGKVGSKGELYPPKKIRKLIGFEPETKVEFIVTPNGELIVKKIESIEDILKMDPIAEVKVNEIEKISEDMQKEGEINS